LTTQFIIVDRDTPYLFPPSVQDYLPENHLARFVVDIVEQLDVRHLSSVYSGKGSRPYHPSMMLALLFYGYASGTFPSRKLEQSTYGSIAYRYLCANTHPDHDSINTFRKRFLTELKGLFVDILVLAKTMGTLKLGTISLDGTKIKANASKHKALSWKYANQLESQLKNEVEELMQLAEQADNSEPPEMLDIPAELERRESRLQAIAWAKQEIEARASVRYEKELTEYEAKQDKRTRLEEKTGKKPRGKAPKPPEAGPKDKDQVNLTDEQSRIMPSSSGGFEQSYNAQASVDIESGLIITNHVTQHTNDKQAVVPTLEQLQQQQASLGKVDNLLADAGYLSEQNINASDKAQITPYISTHRERHNPALLDRFAVQLDNPPETADPVEAMKHRLGTKEINHRTHLWHHKTRSGIQTVSVAGS
jgi:transposase